MTAKRRSIYLPEDQWDILRGMAHWSDRSVNYLVRQAVTEFIAGRPSQTTGESGVSSPAPAEAVDEAPATPPEYREPTDEEARLLREAYPHLKTPKVKR